MIGVMKSFYTPDRCVYTHDIPCYTRYNNAIPLNRRYIRHNTSSNERYTNGIQCIAPVSRSFYFDIESIERHLIHWVMRYTIPLMIY